MIELLVSAQRIGPPESQVLIENSLDSEMIIPLCAKERERERSWEQRLICIFLMGRVCLYIHIWLAMCQDTDSCFFC